MGGFRSGSKLRWLWIALAVVAVIAAAGVGWRWWSANAASKARCYTNQRFIEAAAFAYVEAGPPNTMAQLDGPVDESSPLASAPLGAEPLLPPPVPRCPDRSDAYILKDGRTDCPLHGTYQ
jgi:hypothetical protein